MKAPSHPSRGVCQPGRIGRTISKLLGGTVMTESSGEMLWISGRFFSQVWKVCQPFIREFKIPKVKSWEQTLEDKVNVYRGKVPKFEFAPDRQSHGRFLLVHPQSLCIWGLSLIAWVDHWVTSIFSILSYPFLSFPVSPIGLSHSAGLRSVSKDSLTSQAEWHKGSFGIPLGW